MAGSTAGWDQIRETVAELGRAQLRVGVVGSAANAEHGQTGETNAEIALWMEYGTARLPERNFIRRTLRDSAVRAEYETLLTRITAAVIAGKMDRDRALGLLGAWMASQIQKTIIEDRVEPELAPATVQAKHSDKVLVDTGQLVGSVGWEIVK
jgi:hypothetical protein